MQPTRKMDGIDMTPDDRICMKLDNICFRIDTMVKTLKEIEKNTRKETTE